MQILCAARLLVLFGCLVFDQIALARLPETDWLDLMPETDRLALESMPEISHNTPEAAGTFMQGGLKQRDPNLPQVMYSERTVAQMHNKIIRIGGYPVPLETDEQGRMLLFFLVPYPGACIHVPPPPPNQIILVRYASGIALEDLYAPLWIEGRLKIETVRDDLVDSSYSMTARSVHRVTEADL